MRSRRLLLFVPLAVCWFNTWQVAAQSPSSPTPQNGGRDDTPHSNLKRTQVGGGDLATPNKAQSPDPPIRMTPSPSTPITSANTPKPAAGASNGTENEQDDIDVETSESAEGGSAGDGELATPDGTQSPSTTMPTMSPSTPIPTAGASSGTENEQGDIGLETSDSTEDGAATCVLIHIRSIST